MKQNTGYTRYTWFVLVMVFLVILAGGVVRMTQSGMGCPDWPTCFGRWIPPTRASELPPDFEKYLKQQDIDHSFNVYHTWIEYVNRLLGALLGLFIVGHLAWTFRLFRRTRRDILLLSFLMLITVGFQGWLGKTVVDANLAVVKITLHMIVALVIAALPVLILAKLGDRGMNPGEAVNPEGAQAPVPRVLKVVSVLAIALVLVQIILGTDVREQIDEVSRRLDYKDRDLWIAGLNKLFLVHRSFSWLVALVVAWLFARTRTRPRLRNASALALGLVLVSLATGITMNFFSIPALAQPIHLMAASMLSMTLLWLRVRMR